MFLDENKEVNGFGLLLIASIIISAIVGFIMILMMGLPHYNVWRSAKAGEAQLAQADYNRQIVVKEATAKAAGAVELAKAEVSRAEGVAKANKIIGKSLEGNESYLTYLWLQNLESPYNKTIYIPTEANLPILEAGRLGINPGK